MEERDDESDVAGPVVKAEIVEAAMRPVADGAVAEGHEDAEENVDSDGADGGEADVGGEIEGSDLHLVREKITQRRRGRKGEQIAPRLLEILLALAAQAFQDAE